MEPYFSNVVKIIQDRIDLYPSQTKELDQILSKIGSYIRQLPVLGFNSSK